MIVKWRYGIWRIGRQHSQPRELRISRIVSLRLVLMIIYWLFHPWMGILGHLIFVRDLLLRIMWRQAYWDLDLVMIIGYYVWVALMVILEYWRGVQDKYWLVWVVPIKVNIIMFNVSFHGMMDWYWVDLRMDDYVMNMYRIGSDLWYIDWTMCS